MTLTVPGQVQSFDDVAKIAGNLADVRDFALAYLKKTVK